MQKHKKNRFSMLEVDQDTSSSQKVPSKKKNIHKKDKENKLKEEIIISEEDFNNNLERYNLKNKKKNLQKEKSDLIDNIKSIKYKANLKIQLGVSIILVMLLYYYDNNYNNSNYSEFIGLLMNLLMIVFFLDIYVWIVSEERDKYKGRKK